MSAPHLIRVLKLKVPPLTGKDVEAIRRGSIRYLGDDAAWAAYQKQGTAARRTFGSGMKTLVSRVQKKAKLAVDGIAGPAVDHVLRASGAYDTVCDDLLAEYAAEQIKVCYPHPAGAHSTCSGAIHQTAGIGGNYALDYMAPGGTPVLAVVAAQVVRLSGRSPSEGVVQGSVFAWSMHYRTPDGYQWFSTHYGTRSVQLGQWLHVGQRVGTVASWPHDPGRSHTHLGVTSPHGWSDAIRMIEKVTRAPRISPR